MPYEFPAGPRLCTPWSLTDLFVSFTLLALVYAQFSDHPGVASALRGMSAVAAGLIAAIGLKLFGALLKNVLGLRLCMGFGALCFVAITLLRWPLAYVLFGLGSVACLLAYARLKPWATRQRWSSDCRSGSPCFFIT